MMPMCDIEQIIIMYFFEQFSLESFSPIYFTSCDGRVLADGHIPWACEAFSRLHGHDLAQAPALSW